MPGCSGPTLSVVLSCYNSMHAVAQLRSLRDQTEPPDEIVVIDDSTDERIHPALEAELAHHGSVVVLHRNHENLGMRRSYELGLGLATCQLVATCDHDDIWLPDKLAIVRSAMSDPDVSGITSDGVVMVSDDPVAPPMSPGDDSFLDRQGWKASRRQHRQRVDLAFLLRRNVLSGTSLVFRRELLEHILPLPNDMYPDHWIACVIAACGSLQLLDVPLFRYRIHPANTVGLGERRRPAGEQLRIALARPSLASLDRLRAMDRTGSTTIDDYQHFLELRESLRTASRSEFLDVLRRVPLRRTSRQLRTFYPSGGRAAADATRFATMMIRGKGVAAALPTGGASR